MSKQNLKNIEMTAKFSNFEVLNEDFTRCRCSIFYTGRNRNYSDITEAALDKFISRKGYANIPVVAHLMKDDNGNFYVGSHDRKIILSNEGIDFIDETIPYGVIPEDCNPSKDLIIEKSGIQRKYFSVDVILWSHRYPIMEASYNDEIYFNQSMEIVFDSCETDSDGYVVVHDFHMSALCLLNKRDSSGTDGDNKNQEPCFESSQVKKFSIDESKFKQNFELMLEKLKQYESDGITPATQNTIANNNSQTKGDHKVNYEKIIKVLSTETYKNSDGKDVLKYHLLNVTDEKVFALDMESYTPCGFNYTVVKDKDTDNEYVVIDFDSKTEMSFSASEKIEDENFKEFNIQEEINSAVERFAKENEVKNDEKIKQITNEISEKFQKEYDELKESYDTLMQSHTILCSKVESYEKLEKEAEIQRHKDEIDALVDSYSAKLEKCSAYLIYKASMDKNYSKSREEVEQDLILMAGKYLTRGETVKKKTFSYSPTESMVGPSGVTSSLQNRYGHLLDKYIS